MATRPSPDFTQTGVLLQQVSNEAQQQFQLMNEVPAAQLQRIENQLARIVTHLERLESQIYHQNANAMARLQNSYSRSSDDPLTAPVNPTTGAAIPNTPDNSGAITRLTAPQIRAILQELGQALPANQAGGIALLRRQLRIQMGLRAEQAQGA